MTDGPILSSKGKSTRSDTGRNPAPPIRAPSASAGLSTGRQTATPETPSPPSSARSRWGRRVLLCVGLVAIACLGAALIRLIPITHRFYTDADTIKEPAATAHTRDILWQPPKKLAEIISTAADDYEPRLSADGLTLFFVRGKAGENADILVSRRIPGVPGAQERSEPDGSIDLKVGSTGVWSDPEPLVDVNSEYDDLGPEPSADGRSLYFYSDRPGGSGGYDLWVAHRGDSAWQTPINLGPFVNSEFNDYGPALTPDGQTLYFASNRPSAQEGGGEDSDPEAWQATIREDLYRRDYDLYILAVTSHGTGKAMPLVALNTPYNEGAPAVSSFGDFLYFASDRPGGLGGFDLYRSRRLRGEHLSVKNLGAPVNTEANELDPGLGLGGYALYFSSDQEVLDGLTSEPALAVQSVERDFGTTRPKSVGSTEGSGQRTYDLFYTTSREVFAEAEHVERRPINWAALWSAIGPNLLWALLTLLLLLAFLALLGDLRARRISLLAKCLLASLMAHLLLMFLFNVWEVTASLAREFRRRGHIQIALTSPTTNDDLARQVRGRLTDVETPAPPAMSLQRQAVPVEVQAVAKMATLTVDRLPIDIADETAAEPSAADAAVEQYTERPNTPEALSETVRPMTFDTAVPADAARIATSEADVLTEVQPADSRDVPRPPVAVPGSVASKTTAQLAPARSTDASNDVPSDESSLAEASSIREAAPRPSTAAEVERFDEALEYPTIAELALPQVPADRLRKIQEPASRVAGRVTAAARPDLHGLTPLAKTPPMGELRRVKPTTTEHPAPDSTLVEQPRTRDADSAHLPAPADSHTAAKPESPSLPPTSLGFMAELALPQVPTERLRKTQEPASRVAGRVTAAVRPDLHGLTPLAKAPPIGELRHVKPATTERPPADSTLVKQPTTRDAESVHLPATTDSHTAAKPGSPSLSLTDLTLSAFEVSKATATTEAARPDNPSQPSSVRAAIRRPDLPAGKVATSLSESFAEKYLDPEPAESVVDEPLLAELPQRNATPAGHTHVPPELPETANVAPTLPALADLALPSVEQAAVDPEAEVLSQVVPVSADLSRASVAVNTSAGAAASPMATFDVAASWDRDSGKPRVLTGGNPRRLMPAPLDFDVQQFNFSATVVTPSAFDPVAPVLDVLDLKLPSEQQVPTDPYAQRRARDRMTVVERMGGSEETERAVADALRWLADHQSPDGRWDGDGFDNRCGECGGETDIVVDHALTGLALLSFLGAGHTHQNDGPYQRNVERGLRWLVADQADNGDLRGDETMYSHGIATIALSEAYGMSGDSQLLDPVRRAAYFIDRARNRRSGGWRYDPGQAGDTSVLGWQVMAIKSVSMNRIAVSAESFKAARKWLDQVSSPSDPGLYSYRPGRKFTPAMTAEGMFAQQLLGLPRDDPRMRVSIDFISRNPPDWESTPNSYYWYYATLALFQHQGESWREWNETLTGQLLAHQRKDGRAAGSWDPDGEWADVGGRIYQTALCTLMLEVYYRYLPLYSIEEPVDPIGAIRGFVTDAPSGKAIGGARLRLDLPDRSPVSVVTGPDGGYVLFAPEVPDYFALSASADGYVPLTANVASAKVKGTTLALDFELHPQSRTLIAIEPVPSVHHLGDNNFDGRINSQFQKKSEGASFAAEFHLDDTQLYSAGSKAEIRLLAKGVQRRHKIVINGTVLDERLNYAPSDGSFGEFTTTFDSALLEPGSNTFEIIAKPSSSDIDDFEFVNVQIHLSP